MVRVPLLCFELMMPHMREILVAGRQSFGNMPSWSWSIAAAPRILAYPTLIIGLITLIALTVTSVVQHASSPLQALMAYDDEPTPARIHQLPTSAVLEGDSWSQGIKTQKFWNGRSSSNDASRSNLQGPLSSDPWQLPGLDIGNLPFGDAAWYSTRRGKTHRTVCVRLCDGYFWPISFATTGDNFGRDQDVCERSCGSPAKLFVYENPGQEPEDMVDVKGQPYSKMKSAFLFRSKFDASCKCNPHPWEQEAMNRHKQYAALDLQTKLKSKSPDAQEPPAAKQTKAVTGKAARAAARGSRPAPAEPVVAGRRASLELDLSSPANILASGLSGPSVRVAVLNASVTQSPNVRSQLTPGPVIVAPGLPKGRSLETALNAAIERPANMELDKVANGAAVGALPVLAEPAKVAMIISPTSRQQIMKIGATPPSSQARPSNDWRGKAFEAR